MSSDLYYLIYSVDPRLVSQAEITQVLCSICTHAKQIHVSSFSHGDEYHDYSWRKVMPCNLEDQFLP